MKERCAISSTSKARRSIDELGEAKVGRSEASGASRSVYGQGVGGIRFIIAEIALNRGDPTYTSRDFKLFLNTTFVLNL